MNPSSTSSSKTLHLSGWRRSLVTLATAVVCFALLDTAVRWADPLRLYGGWENPFVQYKTDFARKMARERGRIDVMVMSSSVGLAVDVGKWQEACGDQVVCYSASMGGQRPAFARLMFENVYYPQTKPTHLIYLLTPRDVNTFGAPGKGFRYNAPLWESHNVRRLTATSAGERATLALESASYLYQARRHVRRWVQQGPIPQDEIVITRPNGINEPTVRRTGDRDLTPAEKREGTPVSSFTMPDDGESLHLRELAAFCKSRGVEFVIVNQPFAPSGHSGFDNPKKDYATYLAGLDKLRAAGVRVVDAAAALDLRNSDFGDTDHPNRWGGYRIADYIFREIVRPWFPDKALVTELPGEAEVPLYRLLSADNGGFFLQERNRIGPGGPYAAPLQVATDRPGGRLAIPCDIPPGRYLMELYGADERTTRTGKAVKGHTLALEIAAVSGGDTSATRTVEFEMSRTNVQGAVLNALPLDLETTSRLALALKALAGPECALDTLFLRRVIRSRAERDTDARRFVRGYESPNPAIVRNGGFEYADLRRPGYPAEWEPYTRDREPWGTVRLVDGGRSGGKAVELTHREGKGWGCMIMQILPQGQTELLRNRKVTSDVWVQTKTNSSVFASISVGSEQSDSVRHVPAETRDMWQRYKATISVPTTATTVIITIGSLDRATIFDDISVRADN